MPVPLSIVIATTQPWPEMRMCLASLSAQARNAGAEIIVADGDGRGAPPLGDSSFPDVIWLSKPGASVYELRALGMAKTRGKIVALTEDHCELPPDWCARTLAAHQEFPDAVVIGGAVENGATHTLMDWASFFYASGEAMPPLATGETGRITQLNMSYKRRALPSAAGKATPMEWTVNEDLRKQGERLIADGRIVATHVQSIGFMATCLLHFHGSRALAGFRLARIGPAERVARLFACAVMPPLLFGRAVLTVWRKGRLRGTLMLSLPCLALLVTARAAGAFVGFVSGPGDSPTKIR